MSREVKPDVTPLQPIMPQDSRHSGPLTFKDHGVAYAHLTLPVGLYETEARAIEAAVSKVKPQPRDKRISFLTGQSDVMLELSVDDFRSAVHLQYESEAMGANWLFVVPYSPSDASATLPAPGTDLQLNYVVHLRFERAAYRNVGGVGGVELERRVVDYLQSTAREKGLSCDVMAGFGWSDIVVGGTFSRKESLHDFVVAIAEDNTVAGRRIVRRMLTLVGYDRDPSPLGSNMTVSPLLFARVLPTHIHQAVEALYAIMPADCDWAIYSTDGKWDLVLAARREIPLRDYVDVHRRAVVTGTRLSAAGVERLESHLLASCVEPDAPKILPVPRECGCRELFDHQPPTINVADDEEGLLPHVLLRAVLNVTDLFRAASRDATNCCDVVPSLLRCVAAGRRLVVRYRRLKKKLKELQARNAGDAEIVKWSAVLARAREDIEDWCTYSERSVSQRTVGRFEEFLAQNERVVSYRGGIQKMLYIADVLTNEYARPILPSPEDRTFVTLYDPVDTVVNMRSTGFIRVPVRYLFFLPLAITHLWHEVGVNVFYSNYSIPFDERSTLRSYEFERRYEVSLQDVAQLHVDVAEMYGDFITLHYGFRERVDDFVIALASAMLEQVGFQSATPKGKEVYLGYLLGRLHLVVEFKMRRELIADRMRRSPLTADRDEIDWWRPSRRVVHESLKQLAELLNRELLSHARYVSQPNYAGEPAAEMPLNLERITDHAADMIETLDLGIVHRKYMNDLAWKLPPAVPEAEEEIAAFEAIQRGEVVALGPNVDPNAVYQRLQRSMIERLRDRKRRSTNKNTFLRSTAALMRSVMLSFYERDADVPVSDGAHESLTDLLKHAASLPDKLPELQFVPSWIRRELQEQGQ